MPPKKARADAKKWLGGPPRRRYVGRVSLESVRSAADEVSTVDALVLAMARELGLPRPSMSTAVRLELERRCRAVLAGQTVARALAVWADSVDGPMQGDGRFPDLRRLVGLESRYVELDDLADFPELAEDRALLDATVREEARRVLRSADGSGEISARQEHPA